MFLLIDTNTKVNLGELKSLVSRLTLQFGSEVWVLRLWFGLGFGLGFGYRGFRIRIWTLAGGGGGGRVLGLGIAQRGVTVRFWVLGISWVLVSRVGVWVGYSGLWGWVKGLGSG